MLALFTLKDKSNEGSVKSSKHVASSKEVNHNIYQVQVSGFPKKIEKGGGQAIKTRTFCEKQIKKEYL